MFLSPIGTGATAKYAPLVLFRRTLPFIRLFFRGPSFLPLGFARVDSRITLAVSDSCQTLNYVFLVD